MKKHQEALSRLRDTDLYYSDDSKFHQDLDVLQELVDKATPKKPLKLEEGKYTCPSCSMAFTLKTSIKNMFVNNRYCDVCGQALDWSEDE